jgi:hypothetical protein
VRIEFCLERRTNCPVHGKNVASSWVMPTGNETFRPYYRCAHCVNAPASPTSPSERPLSADPVE